MAIFGATFIVNNSINHGDFLNSLVIIWNLSTKINFMSMSLFISRYFHTFLAENLLKVSNNSPSRPLWTTAGSGAQKDVFSRRDLPAAIAFFGRGLTMKWLNNSKPGQPVWRHRFASE
jgi:hypothetical protein